MNHFIPVGEVLTRIRMLTQTNIEEHGKNAWKYVELDLEHLSVRCRGDQEIKRYWWGRKIALDACSETIANVWNWTPWSVRETNAMNVLDRCREEVYQREVIFANMIDRVATARMFKKPVVPFLYIQKWAAACKEAYVKFDIDEWIENEMLLDDFFS